MNSEDGHDCCVYYKMLKSNIHIYLLLYVDDMLIACKERAEIDGLKQLLISFFNMKDVRSAKKILGVEIIRNRRNSLIFLSQEKYLTKVLETFGMLDYKLVQLPLASHFKLCKLYYPKTEEEIEEMSKYSVYKCCKLLNICYGTNKAKHLTCCECC